MPCAHHIAELCDNVDVLGHVALGPAEVRVLQDEAAHVIQAVHLHQQQQQNGDGGSSSVSSKTAAATAASSCSAGLAVECMCLN